MRAGSPENAGALGANARHAVAMSTAARPDPAAARRADPGAAVADALRAAIAAAVRDRVIGPGGPRRQEAIVASRGPRWFASDRPIRRVHADAAMFVGGLRALLLQSLHPLAMAGVADHSDYRNDPWGRLQRTADFLGATTYGNAAQAHAACVRVRKVHERVVGTAPDGRPYAANDPHLLAWVHLAELDSFLAAHNRYGGERLSRDERDAYVADMAVIARELGVIDPPMNVAEMRAHLARYRPELRGTRAARDAARFLLGPPMPAAARAPYAVLSAAAVGLLPVWARLPLRLPFLPVTETVLVRPAGQALIGTLRWALTPTSAVSADAS
jgi:uncharacterized protein (DUF2236 family)